MGVELLQDYLTEHSRSRPDSPAVTDGNRILNYAELDAFSNRIGRCLREHGVGKGDRVAISLARSVDWMSAIYGCMKAGSAYVPLDYRAPGERWKSVIADSRPLAVICDGKSVSKMDSVLSELALDVPLVILGPAEKPFEGQVSKLIYHDHLFRYEDTLLPSPNSSEDLACIIYTSGSTGYPKGVMITHANILNYVEWVVETFSLKSNDRILGTAPFHFDMSTFDIHAPVAAGAVLCIAKDELTLFPEKLVNYIERQEVTVWKGVASLLMYMCRTGAVKPDRMLTMKSVMFAGEVLPTKYLVEWMRAIPHANFFNCYGPTEATGVSMYHHVTTIPHNAGESVPIGVPCKKETRAFVLNDEGEPVISGEIGELYLSGPCLSPGYWNRSDMNRKVFIPNPLEAYKGDTIYGTGDLVRVREDGVYEFIGRKDLQVKLMGYRIELGEIEHHVHAIDGVREAAAIITQQKKGAPDEITVFYVGDENLMPDDIQRELGKILPNYMLPKQYILLEEIPRCSRGKVQRAEMACYFERGN